MSKISFITKYGPQAIAGSIGSNIFPSVIMAQAILESGWGKSTLASKHNNMFGIKANSGWKGDKVLMKTREVINGKSVYVNSYFRKYATAIESFKDHVKFLKENPRYTKAGVFLADSPLQQITAIKNAGYATATSYVSSIMNIISVNRLMDLDKKKSGF